MMAHESDMRSLSVLSVKSEDSAAAAARARWRNAALHERCSMADMEKIKEAFQEAYQHKMTQIQFRGILKSLLDVDYDDEHYKILFMKVGVYTGLLNNAHRDLVEGKRLCSVISS